MRINKAYCFFEQSGHFKNAFKKHGIQAEDYDILNDFNQTDHIIDLFAEIEKAYNHEKSIFDEITKDDLIFAFFPCTRFEAQIHLAYRGDNYPVITYNDLQKFNAVMPLYNELYYMHSLICKLFVICLRGGQRLIVENPYTPPHFLRTYFPIKPTIIDRDRTENGDYYKKPTQYFFINCKPEDNLIFESIDYQPTQKIKQVNNQVKRSLINPVYCDRFIRRYILDERKEYKK